MASLQGNHVSEVQLAEILLDHNIDRIIVIDINWNIIHWNHASELATGLSKKDALGKNLLEVFPSIAADKEMMDAVHGAFLGNKTVVQSDKTRLNRYYYESHFIPLKESSRKTIGVMHLMHDVAHRLKAEDELKELNATLVERFTQLTKATSELNNFTSITTENVRKPLQHIYTSLELLITSEGRNFNDSSKANLRRMQSSLSRINRFLEDISSLFRISTTTEKFVPIDLNKILVEVQTALNRKIKERNATISGSRLPVITGVPELIKLLLKHILDNALKFQPSENSPVIRITTTQLYLSPVTRSQDPKGQLYHRVTFEDNGIGMDETELDRIFEMFVQLHDKKLYPGSGLGLAFAQKIMETHRGFIKASTGKISGIEISCFFPASETVN